MSETDLTKYETCHADFSTRNTASGRRGDVKGRREWEEPVGGDGGRSQWEEPVGLWEGRSMPPLRFKV
ncbi:hypothetical protein EYF80_011134 [Liparis tanakae]|uniref:Uncharacterized protein n=1 Tax=Liparis tanakae TaxID=230148 RepID=A0A4Z2IKK3_9TELE|nr:hypothetical protein EYF80_011134 [Liparis tanakae]